MVKKVKIVVCYAMAFIAGSFCYSPEVGVLLLAAFGLLHAVCSTNAGLHHRFLSMTSYSTAGGFSFWVFTICAGRPGIVIGSAALVAILTYGWISNKINDLPLLSDCHDEDESMFEDANMSLGIDKHHVFKMK